MGETFGWGRGQSEKASLQAQNPPALGIQPVKQSFVRRYKSTRLFLKSGCLFFLGFI